MTRLQSIDKLARIVKLVTIFTGCKARGASFNPQNNCWGRGLTHIPPECLLDGLNGPGIGEQAGVWGWESTLSTDAKNAKQNNQQSPETRPNQKPARTWGRVGCPFWALVPCLSSPVQVLLSLWRLQSLLPLWKPSFAPTELCIDTYYLERNY